MAKAVQPGADASSLWEDRGEAYAMLGRWKEAAADHAKLVELDPADTTA